MIPVSFLLLVTGAAFAAQRDEIDFRRRITEMTILYDEYEFMSNTVIPYFARAK